MPISLIALDIDGVFTSGYLYFNKDGEETKKISFRDVDAYFRMKRSGSKIGFITGEATAIVDYFQTRFEPDFFIKGCKNKLEALQSVSEKYSIPLEETVYCGDSPSDIPALKACGYSFAPQNADEEVKKVAHCIVPKNGGDGVLDIIEKEIAKMHNNDDLSHYEVKLDSTDPPVQFGHDEYDKVRADLTSIFSQFEDVIGVYEFGKISVPGISDIDSTLLLKNNPADKEIGKKIAEITLEGSTKKIVGDSTLMVFTEATFSRMTLWDDVGVHCLYGKEIELNKYTQDEAYLLTLCQVMDWLPERMLALLRLSQRESVSIMRVLGYLYSIHYTFRKIEQLNLLPHNKISQYIVATKRLREDWFIKEESEKMKEMNNLIFQAVEIGIESLNALSEFLTAKEWYKPSCKGDEAGVFQLTEETGFAFTDKVIDNLPELVEASDTDKGFFLPVPSVWAVHLQNYASVKGVISNKLRGALTGYDSIAGQTNDELKMLLNQRITHCNSMADFLYEHNFKRGLFKFGWFY